MSNYTLFGLDPASVPETPCLVIDRAALEHNLSILADVQQRAECKILLALKGFATFSTFDLVKKHLAGATASSPHEAQLAREELGGEVHVYAPAYSQADFDAVRTYADHIVFNSLAQWNHFRPQLAGSDLSPGLRINPEHSEVEVALYDPCAPHSRLGVPLSSLEDSDLDGLDGLHFHTLCELGVDALERTLQVVEARLGLQLARFKWLNLGGGHHITKPGYDVDRLVSLVRGLRKRYGVEVILEPGEAIAIRTGALVASVLDVVDNGMDIAILDTSATAHMPDVLEMPYRPEVEGAGLPGDKPHTVRLAGLSCLAGDVVGDYAFDAPLRIGDRVVFWDMAHYTTVKTSNFNGVRLPSIALRHADGRIEVVKRFDYASYRDRLS